MKAALPTIINFRGYCLRIYPAGLMTLNGYNFRLREGHAW